MTTDAVATGGCNVFGLDWCTKLFGAGGIAKTTFEQVGLAVLKSGVMQNAINKYLADELARRGIQGLIGTLRIVGDQIIITTIGPCTTLWCTDGGASIGTVQQR